MIHHRRVTSGAHPHSSTSAAGGRNIGSTCAGRPPSGSEHGVLPADAAAALVEELGRDMPRTTVEAMARLPPGGPRCGFPRSKRKGLLGKVAFVAATGTLALLLAAESLTNVLSSPARSMPLLGGNPASPGGTPRRPRLGGAGDGPAAWTEGVAGCTGTADGFVFGGDAGKVLTFVRRGRGGGSGGGRGSGHAFSGRSGGGGGGGGGGSGGGAEGVDRPSLPEVLRWFWKLKHDRGVLAYEISKLEERRDVGRETGWEVVFLSNAGRHKPFPPSGPAEVPWDPSSFNFYKASASEFVVSYTPSFRHEREQAAAAAAGRNDVVPVEIDAAAKALVVPAAGEAKAAGALAALRGAGGKLRAVAAELGGGLSVGCAEATTASPPQDAVLVNIRPVGFVSLLLTPGYPKSHNQRATAETLAVAMDFAEALRGDPGFRLGFNSAGSSASVNHLHFQCWYFDAGPGGLAIEASKTLHAATLPLRRSPSAKGAELAGAGAVEVHTLDGYPIRTLVFHTLGTDLEAVGEVIERCVNFLVEENTPHTIVFSTGRAFLLPRQHLVEPPFAVVPGFPEVSGEIIVTKEEDFRTITADQIYEWWRDRIGVDAQHFDRIVNGCLKQE